MPDYFKLYYRRKYYGTLESQRPEPARDLRIKRRAPLLAVAVSTVVVFILLLITRARWTPQTMGTLDSFAVDDESSDELAPVSVNATYEIVNHTGIVYGQGLANCSNHTDEKTCSRMNLTLDIWEPVQHPPPGTRRPAMVLIHGGSFSGGDATEDGMGSDGPWFAERGWTVFSINYRLVGDHGLIPEGYNIQNTRPSWLNESNFIAIWGWMYPAVRDSKAAIRFVRANADRYQIDENKITVLGGSAGACAALAIGVTFQDDYKSELEATDSTLETTHLSVASHVRTVVSHWGCLDAIFAVTHKDGVERWRREGMPPVAAYHGTNDTEVSPQNSMYLCQMYKLMGIDCHLTLLDGWGHDCWNARVFPKDLDVRGAALPSNISQNDDTLAFLVEQQDLPLAAAS